MDFLVLSTLRGEQPNGLVFTYDLSCQYEKKFVRRMLSYPDDLHLDFDPYRIRFAIPKKHWPVHGADHSRWSLNFLRWMGRIYGEGVESGWSHINPVSWSTREMAPQARNETLDSHWDAYNFQKKINLGKLYFLAFGSE